MSGPRLLPFVPAPYSDEVLGSWLARVEACNGSGAWLNLTHRSGMGYVFYQIQFDLLNFNPRIEMLFDGLGVSYEEAIKKHSTLKFWSVFRGASQGVVPGTTDLRMPATSIAQDTPMRSLRGLGRLTSSHEERWHCSSCIAEDIDERRQPYWRTHHQLVTSFYCFKHSIALRSSCASCGASTRSMRRNGWGMLTRICECGTDRRIEVHGKQEIPEIYERLGRIGEEALAIESVDLSWGELQQAMLALARRHDPLCSKRYMPVLREAFSALSSETGAFVMRPPGALRELVHRSDGAGAAVRIPMMFAILGLSIEEAISRYRAMKSTSDKPIRRETKSVTSEIATARAYFQQRMLQGIESPASMRSYCYLRIWDLDWLQAKLGRKLKPLPSLAEDRHEIETRLKADDPTLVLRCAVMRRMMARDMDTYEKVRAILAPRTIQKKRSGMAQKVLRQRQDRLGEALKVLLAQNDSKPRHISYNQLGRVVGLSGTQAMLAILNSPALSEQVAEARRTLKERQLRWIIWDEHKKRKGRPVRISAVMARLPYRGWSKELVELFRSYVTSLPAHE
ncbi:TniQ protein [Collimonas sp. OK307]|uniref:TniQ family protein n=1 Tax=Collimonas sp. OK307 TaxID=1801620 RepID=UPI0008E17731|nr:TniQ family protein [Collimonas sp. OK307]SFI37427.1 TniQ protein [Collimonas sp. OK307]